MLSLPKNVLLSKEKWSLDYLCVVIYGPISVGLPKGCLGLFKTPKNIMSLLKGDVQTLEKDSVDTQEQENVMNDTLANCVIQGAISSQLDNNEDSPSILESAVDGSL